VEKQMECRLTGETEVLGENLPQRHFCPSQNPTCRDPGLNPCRRCVKPATNRLSYGAAPFFPYSSPHIIKWLGLLSITPAFIWKFPVPNPDSETAVLTEDFRGNLTCFRLSSVISLRRLFPRQVAHLFHRKFRR
jgi:hypothetical protein